MKKPYIDKLIDQIKWEEVWKMLSEQKTFCAMADDTRAKLFITTSQDGDVWINIEPDPEYQDSCLRFRTSKIIAGARSDRMRPLLMLLALGIFQDQIEKT